MTYTFKVLEMTDWLRTVEASYGDFYDHREMAVGDIVEFDMGIKEYDQFKADHPELERYHDTPPSFRFDGRTFGSLRGQTDATFKERLAKIGEAHPASPLGDEYRKNKTIKEVQTREILKKHKFGY